MTKPKMLIGIHIDSADRMEMYIKSLMDFLGGNSTTGDFKVNVPYDTQSMLKGDLLLLDYNFEKMEVSIKTHSKAIFEPTAYNKKEYEIRIADESSIMYELQNLTNKR